jgi:pyruvate/2-oxoglutarate/acetoin dehydrogenase E1 component
MARKKIATQATGHMMSSSNGNKSTCCIFSQQQGFSDLKAPIKRIGLPDCHSPAGNVFENFYYPTAASIKKTIFKKAGQ